MVKFTVAVAGGGIAGLALAAELSKDENIRVDVYEASKKFDEVGVGLTLWGRVWEALRLMGIADECTQTSVRNAASSGLVTESVGFHLRDFRHPDQDYGVLPMKDARSLHRADLLHILLRQVPRTSAHLDKKLTSYVEDTSTGKVTLRFADGTLGTCDVLVGCDGIRSTTRSQMIHREIQRTGDRGYQRYIEPRWSGTTAYRFLMPSAGLAAKNPHHSLLSGPQIYFGKSMHIVGYPISQTQLNAAVSITDLTKDGTRWPGESWSAKHDRNSSAERIQPLFSHWHAEAREIVETIGETIEWAIHDLEPLPFYVRGRVALVGDAAHASMPYVGSGAAFAIEDAFVLARILKADVTTRETLHLALEAYDYIRRPYGNSLVVNARKASRAFQYIGPDGDDMPRVQRTICKAFEECGAFGQSGPKADANKGVAWLERRVSRSC